MSGSLERKPFPNDAGMLHVVQCTGKMGSLDNLHFVPYEWPIVRFVDYIIDKRIELGRPTMITNENHWNLLELIIKGWSDLYPKHSHDFFQHMRTIRSHANHLGVAREKGGATLQHQVEIPEKLYSLIRIAFPNQKWDKNFILKFARRMPAFMGADKI